MRTGKKLLPLVVIAMMVALPSYTFAAQVNVTTTTTTDTVRPGEYHSPGRSYYHHECVNCPHLPDSGQLCAGNSRSPGAHRLFESA
jgi:hypothetical protein